MTEEIKFMEDIKNLVVKFVGGTYMNIVDIYEKYNKYSEYIEIPFIGKINRTKIFFEDEDFIYNITQEINIKYLDILYIGYTKNRPIKEKFDKILEYKKISLECLFRWINCVCTNSINASFFDIYELKMLKTLDEKFRREYMNKILDIAVDKVYNKYKEDGYKVEFY